MLRNVTVVNNRADADANGNGRGGGLRIGTAVTMHNSIVAGNFRGPGRERSATT